MPVTFWTFLLATLAIAGVPGFSGFFSKDEILWNAFSSPQGHFLLWLIGFITAGMTAFYMFRLCFMAFCGDYRGDKEVWHHAHESPPVMTVPMVVLAVLSVIGGYVGVPAILGGANHFHPFLAPVFGVHEGGGHEAALHLLPLAWAGEAAGEGGHGSAALELFMMVLSVVMAFAGIYLAYAFYLKRPDLPKALAQGYPRAYRVLFNKYYVDEIYQFLFVDSCKRLGTILWRQFDEAVVDRTVNLVAAVMRVLGGGLRLLQTGFVQDYALGIVLGAVIVMLFLL